MTPSVTTAVRPPLYSTYGWTERLGILDLLTPFFLSSPDSSDFVRFEGLGATEAEALLEIMPADALLDQQNNGPYLCELLRLAVERPGVTLSGYRIAPPRWDERISVDGVSIPQAPDLPQAIPSDPLVLYKWPKLRAQLALNSAMGEPDELLALPLEGGGYGWWIWWD